MKLGLFELLGMRGLLFRLPILRLSNPAASLPRPRYRGRPASVRTLEKLGRERLSRHFFMRDFLHSEIAQIHGLANIPDDPALAVTVGRHLAQSLLEPLVETFGPIAVRSAYRAPVGQRDGPAPLQVLCIE